MRVTKRSKLFDVIDVLEVGPKFRGMFGVITLVEAERQYEKFRESIIPRLRETARRHNAKSDQA